MHFKTKVAAAVLYFIIGSPNIWGVITCSLLFTEHSLFVMVFRYSYSVFVSCYSYALFVIHMRYLKFCFFRKTLFCAVTNNESNAITCYVCNRKIN